MMIISKEKRCSECILSEYVSGPSIMACGYKCRLNPLKPIFMGISGKHSQRNEKAKRAG